VREYVEHDSGGKSSDYPKQLGQVFTNAARREFDPRLVWSLDRFSPGCPPRYGRCSITGIWRY
jgi:hypothetical protein